MPTDLDQPYRYMSPDGDILEIRPLHAPGGVLLNATDKADGQRTSIAIRPRDRDGLVAAVYAAAGQPEPIILPRSLTHTPHMTSYSYNGHRIMREGQWVNIPAARMLGHDAKSYASHIAALAEIAENEPDSAQVERLAAFFNEAMDTTPESLARAFLARFEAPAERAR